MRLGLDLRAVADHSTRLDLAVKADRLGLWAVLVGGTAGTEVTEATAIAISTDHIHLAVHFDVGPDHPLTVAEEVAVLDHLSQRRALAIVDGSAEVVTHVDRLLAGNIVDGVALAPPPAQTRVPVWPADAIERVDLSGDLESDRQTIDTYRDGGCTHLFVTWPHSLLKLARHLATRAAGPDFPQIVADLADVVDEPRE